MAATAATAAGAYCGRFCLSEAYPTPLVPPLSPPSLCRPAYTRLYVPCFGDRRGKDGREGGSGHSTPRSVLAHGNHRTLRAKMHTAYRRRWIYVRPPRCIVKHGQCVVLWLAGRSGSNTLVHLVTRYPGVKVVCLDKVNYCASVQNFEEVKNKANFTFVLVGSPFFRSLVSPGRRCRLYRCRYCCCGRWCYPYVVCGGAATPRDRATSPRATW